MSETFFELDTMLDQSDMRGAITEFPNQIKESFSIMNRWKAQLGPSHRRIGSLQNPGLCIASGIREHSEANLGNFNSANNEYFGIKKYPRTNVTHTHPATSRRATGENIALQNTHNLCNCTCHQFCQ